MADMLGSPDDLRTLLGEDSTTLPDTKAILLLEMATAEVQAAARQRLVQVVDDQLTIMGTTDSWLELPERPVTAVSEVAIDGSPVADWKRFGARLWRQCGWASCPYEPATVTLTYTHGYPADDEALELATKMVYGLAANMFANPVPASAGVSIDDYREQFFQAGGQRGDMLPARSQMLLRRRYGGSRAGLVRIG
jgi:hypothetical protein